MPGSSQDPARLFNAYVSTIRRDLDLLASEGLIRRTLWGSGQDPAGCKLRTIDRPCEAYGG